MSKFSEQELFEDDGEAKGADKRQAQGEDIDMEDLMCGVNFQRAMKILMKAHSRDLMEFENEFQKRKAEWDKERKYLIDLVNKFKQQSKMYKSFLVKNGISFVDGGAGSGADDTGDSNTVVSPTAEKKKRTYTKKKDIVVDESISSATQAPVTPKTTKKQGGSSTKKRKSPYKDNETVEDNDFEKDDLDLPNEFIPSIDNKDSVSILNSTFQRFNNNNNNNVIDLEKPSSQMDNREKKKIKTKETVRNQEAREKLKGFECEHCKEFYDIVLGDNEESKKNLINLCSRHRHEEEPPSTPPGFWDFNFDTKTSKDTTNDTAKQPIQYDDLDL